MQHISRMLTVAVASLALVAAMPTVTAPAVAAKKPIPTLTFASSYAQFVKARGIFVRMRFAVRPDLVRVGWPDSRGRRVSRLAIDWRSELTFDVPGAEENTYQPAERVNLWIRVRRARDEKGVVRTVWYDAHGGTGFANTPITTLIPPPAKAPGL
jgi:hypothetical protein